MKTGIFTEDLVVLDAPRDFILWFLRNKFKFNYKTLGIPDRAKDTEFRVSNVIYWIKATKGESYWISWLKDNGYDDATKYRGGMILKDMSGHKYLLSKIDYDKEKGYLMVFTSLYNGNRLTEAGWVKDWQDITEEEFEGITKGAKLVIDYDREDNLAIVDILEKYEVWSRDLEVSLLHYMQDWHLKCCKACEETNDTRKSSN